MNEIEAQEAIERQKMQSQEALNAPMIPINYVDDLKLIFCQIDPGDYATTKNNNYALCVIVRPQNNLNSDIHYIKHNSISFIDNTFGK